MAECCHNSARSTTSLICIVSQFCFNGDMKRGFTLIEIMIVITIIAILFIALMVSIQGQRSKGEDARVKSDLDRLKIAFEDYYNDQNCYPPQTWFDSPNDCGSSNLQPYLNQIPCDKNTGEPYVLRYSPSQCTGFQLYGYLQNDDDAAYSQYYENGSTLIGTYGVSSGNTTPQNPGTTSGTQGTGGGGGESLYWCSGLGNCTSYDANEFSCTPNYAGNNCDGQGCLSVGSCTPL